MTDKHKNKIAVIVVFSIVVMALWVLIKDKIDFNDIKRNERYTIGQVVRIIGVADTGPDLEVEYMIENIMYKVSISYTNNKHLKVGDSVYIKFSSQNPKNAVILPNCIIQKDFSVPPESGWDTIICK